MDSVTLDRLLLAEPELAELVLRERQSDESTARTVRELRARAKERRRRTKRYGRPQLAPRADGARSQQYAPSLTPQRKALLQEEGVDLQPYYNETARGVPTDGRQLSTSWVDNVAFEFTITSSGPEVEVRDAIASRAVLSPDGFLQQAFSPNGVPEAGGEYAIFEHSLGARDVLRSSASERFGVSLRAQYTQDGIQVVRRVTERQLDSSLSMRRVHPVLMSNGDNGQSVIVTKADGSPYAVLRKDGRLLAEGPRASVVRGPFRWTFRYDPTRRWWRLVHVAFAVQRYSLQGIEVADRRLYVDPTWRVDGVALEQRYVSAAVEEDPGSNPLDPMLYLTIIPNRSEVRVAGIPVRIGESQSIALAFTTQLEPRRATRRGSATVRTRYVELPSLDVQIPDVGDLLRRTVPSAGYWVELDRNDLDKPRADFTSSENTLHNAPARVRIELAEDGGGGDFEYEIVALRIGPIRQSALREAFADKRNRV